jgi:hypothetical protein
MMSFTNHSREQTKTSILRSQITLHLHKYHPIHGATKENQGLLKVVQI